MSEPQLPKEPETEKGRLMRQQYLALANAPERIVGVLGAIAKAENLPSRFNAVVWVLLPINELATRQQIASRF